MLVGRRPVRTLVRAGVLVVVSAVVFKFVLIPIRVTGISMEPTYRNGGINFINRLSYAKSKPQRGDVVGIQLAGYHVMLLKRIVGLPGERVAIIAGRVLIDGRPQTEPYTTANENWVREEVRLGAQEYFVVGDNRVMSIELHDMREVDESRIVGKVIF